MHQIPKKVGVVVIGRNEGDRLKRCLHSVCDRVDRVVYVDSGSTDGSQEFAKSLGVDVVDLDMSRPFTMARGRNSGFKRMFDIAPEIEFVQFIDGDCELIDGYLEKAVDVMERRSDVTVVTGIRMERFPEASIYNRLCDIEWGRDIGEIRSCGGDMMVRCKAFRVAGMFNPEMIAGEEPELCVRLRKAGGKIVRINHEMTLHDAAITKFSQWWKRALRSGHAYAEGAAMHGRPPERHNMKNVRSALLWGAVVPIMAIGSAVTALWLPWTSIGFGIMLAGYIALAVKIFRHMKHKGFNASDALLYSTACIIAKFPCLIGMAQYWLNRLRGKRSSLIEYKHVTMKKNSEQKTA